jgi:hypothetical protein
MGSHWPTHARSCYKNQGEGDFDFGVAGSAPESCDLWRFEGSRGGNSLSQSSSEVSR